MADNLLKRDVVWLAVCFQKFSRSILILNFSPANFFIVIMYFGFTFSSQFKSSKLNLLIMMVLTLSDYFSPIALAIDLLLIMGKNWVLILVLFFSIVDYIT